MDGGRQLLTTVITLVLARILGPEPFGVIAVALSYVLFVDMLQRQGLSSAIIQRDELDDDHLDAAFWAVLALSGFLTVASMAAGAVWSDSGRLVGVGPVLFGLAFLVPLRGLSLIHEAVLHRAMDFRSLALRTNAATVCGGLVGVTAAFAGAGVWSLVAQQLTSAAVNLVLVWQLCAWRPRRRFRSDALRDLFGFSARSFVATVGVYLGNRSDALLIGLFFGVEVAGLYYFASRLVTMVTDLAARALQTVALPDLARFQSDRRRLAARAVDIIVFSGTLAVPLLALLAAGAAEVVAVVGSDQWGPIVPVLRILAVVGMVRSVTLLTGPVLLAMGAPGVHARLSWIGAALSAAGWIVAGVVLRDAQLETQVIGLAWSRLAVHVVFVWLFLRPIVSLPGVRAGRLARRLVPAAVMAAAALGTGLLLSTGLRSLDVWVRAPLVAVGAVAVALLVATRAATPVVAAWRALQDASSSDAEAMAASAT